MKIQGVIFWFLVIGAFVLNGMYLKISWWTFTGIVLGGILALGFILSLVFKILKKNKEKNAFILPDSVARVAKNMEMKTQYESAILAMFGMMLSALASGIYYVFIAAGVSTSTRVIVGINATLGAVLLGSMLVSQFQSYTSFMEAQEIVANFTKQPIINQEVIVNPIKEEIVKDDQMKGGIE